MHDAYRDIRSRIPEEPLWYDVDGVPRYDPPHVPRHLMGRIRCQDCREEFWVSLTDNIYHSAAVRDEAGLIFWGDGDVETDPEKVALFINPEKNTIRNEHFDAYLACEHLRLRADWHYGDPPAHGCVGDTMISVPEYEWAEFWPEEVTSDAS
jgi:hypothetical protein